MASTAHDFVDQFFEAMKPRDPLERMLLSHLLWQHARIGRLVECADRHVDVPDHAKAYGGLLENAMNTFRRHLQAFDSLRTPRPLQFINGAQVNVGHQQVVANGGGYTPVQHERPSCANEQGLPATQTGIPADSCGPCEPAAIDREGAPLGKCDRPEDGKR